MELNHPFFIYPREPFSPYKDYILYRKEIIRLHEFIDNFNTSLKNSSFDDTEILLNMILGSSMEDSILNSYTPESNIFQSSQLFPQHIKNFINKECKKKNKLVQIIIISPDRFFQNENYFPTFTNFIAINFNKINLYEFEAKLSGIQIQIQIKINIFNCPFPSHEIRNDLILRYNNVFIDFLKKPENNINTFSQTIEDKIFIDTFYKSVELLLSTNNYFQNDLSIIINSWVSFKNLDGFSENYSMFPKLLELSDKYNIITTEWDFVDELIYCKIISKFYIQDKCFKNRLVQYSLDDFDKVISTYGVLEINTNYAKQTNNTVFSINFLSDELLDKI